MKKILLALSGIFAVIAAALFLVRPASPSPIPAPEQNHSQSDQHENDDNPVIAWSVSKVSETLYPGTTKTVTIQFTSKLNLSNVAVAVSSTEDEFSNDDHKATGTILSVSPSGFSSIVSNRSYQLAVTMAAPTSFKRKHLTSTIYLKNKSDQHSQYRHSLTVDVVIDFVNFSNPSSGVIFSYPVAWRTIQDSSGIDRLYSPSATAALLGGDVETPADITIALHDNSVSLPLDNFVASYQGGWLSLYDSVSTGTVDGHEALLLNDLAAPVPRFLALATFISVHPAAVLIVTGHASTQAEFSSIIKSLQLPLR